MRKLIVSIMLAGALILPAAALAWESGSPQDVALANPDKSYVAPDECVQWTPTSARTWWTIWFAKPYDLRTTPPCELPGSLVLTTAEYKVAVAINEAFARTPVAPTVPAVQAVAGPTAAQLKAIRDRAEAVGKHPSDLNVLRTFYLNLSR